MVVKKPAKNGLAKGKQNPAAAVSNVPRASGSPTLAIGVHNQSVTSGLINSREVDASLVGREKYTTFSNMFNVSIICTGIRYFLHLCGKAAWRAEPSDPDNPESVRLAELVEDMMHDMVTPWHRVVRHCAMFRYYGFDIEEWIIKRRKDGVIGYKDIQKRAQSSIERWDVEDDGTVRGVVQRSPQTFKEIYIPRDRVIYLKDDALSDSPEGLGLFRHLVEPVKRLNKYLQLEGWGYENDLRGIPIVRAPLQALAEAVKAGTITQSQSNELTAPLDDFIDLHARNPNLGMKLDSQTWQTADEAARPSGMMQFDVQLLDGGTYSLEEIASAINRLNQDIARMLGIEHMLLGFDGVGSLALAKDKSDNFAQTVDATLREIRETFQNDFLGPIWELNGWDEELKPKLQTEQLTNRDITRIGEALSAMSRIGIVLSREDRAVTEYLELIGLSPLPNMSEVDPDLADGTNIERGLEQSADAKAQVEASEKQAEAQAQQAKQAASQPNAPPQTNAPPPK